MIQNQKFPQIEICPEKVGVEVEIKIGDRHQVRLLHHHPDHLDHHLLLRHHRPDHQDHPLRLHLVPLSIKIINLLTLNNH